jgi:hypothetical protein
MKELQSIRYSQRALCCVLLLSLAHSTSGVCPFGDRLPGNFRQTSISNFNWNLTWDKPACADNFPTSYGIKVIISEANGNSYDCHQFFSMATIDTNNIVSGALTNSQDTCGYVGAGSWVVGGVKKWFMKGSAIFDFRLAVRTWAIAQGLNTNVYVATSPQCSLSQKANGCYDGTSPSGFGLADGNIQWNSPYRPYYIPSKPPALRSCTVREFRTLAAPCAPDVGSIASVCGNFVCAPAVDTSNLCYN